MTKHHPKGIKLTPEQIADTPLTATVRLLTPEEVRLNELELALKKAQASIDLLNSIVEDSAKRIKALEEAGRNISAWEIDNPKEEEE